MSTLYTILDIDDFAKTIRHNAACSMSENYTENLDEFITISQIKDIICKNSVDTDHSKNYIIDATAFDKIFEIVADSIYQSGLAKLAANNKIDCAWDSDSNKMIFWIKTSNGQVDIPNNLS